MFYVRCCQPIDWQAQHTGERQLTNEIELHEAFAKFKNAFKASVLSICRTLQREEVNEQI